MDWVWELYRDYIRKYLRRMKIYEPDENQLQESFIQIMNESTITILVQEPWQNAIRFKGLHKDRLTNLMPLIQNPDGYLFEKYGGGKYKLNFHQGMNFIATINYKPEGEPKWKNLPSIPF